MNVLDFSIIIVWLTITLVAGMRAGLGANLDGFWVNGRSTLTPWLVFTIVATQVGGGVVVGMTSSSFSSGIGFGLVALASTVSGFLAIAWLAPWAKRFGDKHSAYTLPEVIGKRYGRPSQLAAAILIIVTYLSLFAGQILPAALLVQHWTGWGAGVALALAAGGVIGYSAFAGLKGDIVTDGMHFCAMALVLLVLVPCAIVTKYPAMQMMASVPPPAWSPVKFGGYSYLVVGLALGVLIPIVSMEMWMRVYAASNEKIARRAFVWSAAAVTPFYVLPILLGLFATQIDVFKRDTPDRLFFDLMFSLFPNGLLGIAIAAFLAVLISTANTYIVVLGAVIYRDLFGRHGGSTASEVKTSRLLTLIIGCLGMGLAFGVPDVVQLILNAFFILGMIAPVLLGLRLWKRATGKGAVAALIVGGVTTLACLPIIPRQAFLPGLILGTLTFVLVSLLTSHSLDEDLNM